VNVTNGAGGIENIIFLEGGDPVGAKGPNADTALVYATFWIGESDAPAPPSVYAASVCADGHSRFPHICVTSSIHEDQKISPKSIN
jgi:hypothetical protein